MLRPFKYYLTYRTCESLVFDLEDYRDSFHIVQLISFLLLALVASRAVISLTLYLSSFFFISLDALTKTYLNSSKVPRAL